MCQLFDEMIPFISPVVFNFLSFVFLVSPRITKVCRPNHSLLKKNNVWARKV